METKICNKCKLPKPISSYCKKGFTRHGRQRFTSICKDCISILWKNYSQKNREKLRAAGEKYRKNNPQKDNEWFRNLSEDKKEIRRIRSKTYNQEHKEERRLYDRQYKALNKDKINLYRNKKREEDANFKLAANLRHRISQAVRKNKSIRKGGSAVRDLGCSISELKIYLENRFRSEMSWGNYGSYWHIDHIIPLSHFNLSDREQFLKACHYTNLQPLTAQENWEKGNRYVNTASR